MINIIFLLVLYYFVSDFECKVTNEMAKVSCSNLPKCAGIIVQIFQNAVKWAFCAFFLYDDSKKDGYPCVGSRLFLMCEQMGAYKPTGNIKRADSAV